VKRKYHNNVHTEHAKHDERSVSAAQDRGVQPSRSGDRDSNNIPDSLNYPPAEDITRQAKREELDVENITRSGKYTDAGNKSENPVSDEMTGADDEINIIPGTEADVTAEDIEILDSTDNINQTSKLDNTEENIDLDIPGSELDDKDEELGEEDEENNYYSLGGDRHEDLEEDRS
jgi:hypothetical protein